MTRARKRRPEILDSTALAHRTAKKPRYYCPGCGMVRKAEAPMERQVIGNVVQKHMRMTGTGRNKSCPGGKIDLIRDRAP